MNEDEYIKYKNRYSKTNCGVEGMVCGYCELTLCLILAVTVGGGWPSHELTYMDNHILTHLHNPLGYHYLSPEEFNLIQYFKFGH